MNIITFNFAKMNIKELIRYDLPDFTGICVQEGVPLNTARELGVTLSWKIRGKGIENAIKYNKIIVVGNNNHDKKIPHESYNDEKGIYFTAQITDIISMYDYLQETNGMADENIRRHHIWDSFPKYKWDKERYILFFENATEIEPFSIKSFRLMQNPIFYLK